MESGYEELADAVVGRLLGSGPHVVGLGGAVAVGKTTIAQALAGALDERGRSARVVATDAFLYPNAVLDERGITFRKGFPESYDMEALMAFVGGVKGGARRIGIPVYSHTTYDIVPSAVDEVLDPDVVILEGVVALQAPVVDALDVAVFVDAAEEDVKAWFVERFVRLVEEGRSDPVSFYARFAEMPPERLRALAEGTWDAINGPNLREHIAPSLDAATLVLVKGSDHSTVGVVPGPQAEKGV